MSETYSFPQPRRARRLPNLGGGWLVIALCATASLAFACKNSRLGNLAVQIAATGTTASTGASSKFYITNVTIANPAGTVTAPTGTTAGVASEQATIYFDTTVGTTAPTGGASTNIFPGPMTSFCSLSPDGTTPSASPCYCKFTWDEVNTVTSTSTTQPKISHVILMPLTLIQNAVVRCTVPPTYDSEISISQILTLEIVPGTSNPTPFVTSKQQFNKQGALSAGNFQDAQGRSYANVLRYSCYDQRTRGQYVTNRVKTLKYGDAGGSTANGSASDPDPLVIPLATHFCVPTNAAAAAAGSGATADILPSTAYGDCKGVLGQAAVDYSSQAYYYNLYIRENEKGDINPGNGRYTCPQVREGLVRFNQSNTGSASQYWPLDSTFALSLGKTPDFSIGVVANSKTSSANGADPNISASSCDSSSSSGGGSANGNTLLQSCLGFAAKPLPDGSCPKITVNQTVGATLTSILKPTYRLRRYVMVYPPIFDADGDFFKEPQASDTIYVLDRPVAVAGDTSAGFSMLGPKPCPFAYWDSKRVMDPTNASYYGRYVATNDPAWAGKNVDGIQFPNVDRPAPSVLQGPSCSAMLPLVNGSHSMMTVGTVNARNHYQPMKQMFVRPIKPFTPHYEEDTDFQACAPLSSTYKEPPLHFERYTDPKDSSKTYMAYCAEAYPTQNDNLALLDPKKDPNVATSETYGLVSPLTSHIRKGVTYVPNGGAPASCDTDVHGHTALTLPSNYATSGCRYGLKMDEGILCPANNNPPYPFSLTCDRTVVNPLNQSVWAKFPLLAPPTKVELALRSDPSYSCLVTYDTGANGASKIGKSTPGDGCCALYSPPAGDARTYGKISSLPAHLEPDATCAPPNWQTSP